MTSAIYQELSERAAVIYEKVVMWRRDFHRYPELAGHEERTSGLVAEHPVSYTHLTLPTNRLV